MSRHDLRGSTMTAWQRYPYIAAWHVTSGSMDYYINDLIAKARKSKAPSDALFQRDDGTWARYSDLKDAPRESFDSRIRNNPRARALVKPE